MKTLNFIPLDPIGSSRPSPSGSFGPLRPSRHGHLRRAFSLLELLAVMAVLAILATMTMTGVGSIMKGHALRDASQKAWGAVSNARQLAVARRAPVALVLTTGRSVPDDSETSEAVMLLAAEIASNGTVTWKPESRWIALPNGVEIAPQAGSFYTQADASAAEIGTALPQWQGDAISEFTYVIFRPDGSVDAPVAKQPVLGFRRLNVASVDETETVLVLSPETGRMRLMQL